MSYVNFFRGIFQQSQLEVIPQVVLNVSYPSKEYQIRFVEDKQYLHIYTENEIYSDELYFENTPYGLKARRVFKNNSRDDIYLKELKTTITGMSFGGNPKDDYFYSVENVRVYETHTFPLDYNRTSKDASDSEFDVQANNRWADPGVVSERINNSPYQPFPAILISNYKTKSGFVHGSLSQNIFYHNYIVGHKDGQAFLEIYSSCKALDFLKVAPNRILVDEWYLGTTENADDFNRIFDNYTKILRSKLLGMRGNSDVCRKELVWGSWNDGIFRNVSHKGLVEEARAIKRYFPQVKWFQLDDGYAIYNRQENDSVAHGLGVPYENDGIDYEKFPNGLKAFTDEIRVLGLRPALWIGGWIPVKSKIYKEHPEWVSDYSERLSRSQPLDVSVCKAREYMCNAIDTLITDYGFDSVKHDFWSYPFEASSNLYRNKDKTGYEYRRWWLTELRKRLPQDGYMQTGCDIALGNPFLGEFFNNYRYGIDVCSGNWDHVKTTILWGCACFATHTGDLFIPNSDAVGMLPDLNDTDFLCWIHYVWITHSMVELSGRYSLANLSEYRLKVLRKVTCNINNGQDVYFCGFDYRKNEQKVPEIMYTKTPHFSTEEGKDFMPLRTVALFNFSEEAKIIEVIPIDLGLSIETNYVYTDVWNLEQSQEPILRVTLQPHESRMFAINEMNDFSIFDANLKMSNVIRKKNEVFFKTDATKTAELFVSKKVNSLKVNEKEIPFEYENGIVKFSSESGGRVSFSVEE